MSRDARPEPREIDLDTLREGFAALACEEGREAPGPCPEPGTLYDAVRGRLAPRALREVVEHVAACPECAEDWRLAMTFEKEAGDLPVADPEPVRSRRRPALRLVPLAATLVVALLAAGVWFTVGQQAPEEAPIFRDAGPAAIVPLPAEEIPLDRTDPVLRWRVGSEGAPAGTTYDLLVSTVDGRLIAEESGLEETRFRLPADAVEDLLAETELHWQVDARLPDGTRASSRLFVTRLP